MSLLLAFLLPLCAGVIASEANQSHSLSPLVGVGEGGGITETTKVQETYGKLTLYFIQNDGQVDEKVKFYEKGNGHATFFTKEGVYLSLVRSNDDITKDETSAVIAKPEGSKQSQSATPFPLAGKEKGGESITSDVIKLSFIDANPNPEISAEGPQEGKVNYFLGNDPKKWRTNVPTYQAVVYKEIYPGIDVKFYGNNRQLEYDIIVKPGADPSKVQLAYEGIEGLRVTEDGDLEIGLKEGKIIQKRPVVYQEVYGERVALSGMFRIPPTNSYADSFTYSFEVVSYDTNQPLIIDPVLVYSTYLGGSSFDLGNGVAVDFSGNAYVVGETGSFDFPTASPWQGAISGSVDAFVAKLNPAGTALIYSTYLGGSALDVNRGIAVDASGNAYVTGNTSSSDFPTVNPVQATLGGTSDAIIAKLNAAGTALAYSTYLGGDSSSEYGSGIAVDTSGNAYVTGYTASTNFPMMSPVQAAFAGGYSDAFVTKLDSAGTALVYSTYLGGNGMESGTSIVVDTSGSAYVTGGTDSTNFPTANPVQVALGGGGDAFATKFNAAGTALAYSTYLGGSGGGEEGKGIAVDPSGSAYVTGWTSSSNFPTISPVQAVLGGSHDAFVIKLNVAGTAVAYSTYLGGSGVEEGNGIAVDASGSVYVTGRTTSFNFPTASPVQTALGSDPDAFVSKISPSPR